MDIFNQDAFSSFELTDALELVPYRPMWLESLNIFEPMPVRTTAVGVEQREETLALVPTSPRGAPPTRRDRARRNIRNFNTARIALADRLNAEELQNIRAFGTFTEFEQVQEEVMRRQLMVRQDVMLTLEHMRLGAVQGLFLDADGSTILNWFDEFGITQATEIDFDLDAASPVAGALIQKCNQVIRAMARAAKGFWIDGQTRVAALAGDTFWDQFTTHTEVRQSYLNWEAAASLRNVVGAPWTGFLFGNIEWFNYRGTDDGSTVAVPATKAKFFPVGGRQVFQWAKSPGESLDMVNTPGRDFISLIVPDRDRNEWVDVEVRSYPLMVCKRPGMLQSARNT